MSSLKFQNNQESHFADQGDTIFEYYSNFLVDKELENEMKEKRKQAIKILHNVL